MNLSAHAESAFRAGIRLDAGRGELRAGEARYLLLRADSLMGTIERLPGPARRQALAALCDAVAAAGRHSVEAYVAAGAATAEDLLRMVETAAAVLGWGRWTFTRAGVTTDDLHLLVVNSPFAAAAVPSPEPVCAAVAGMLQAVAGLIFAGPVAAEETSCAATGHAACHFRAWALPGREGERGKEAVHGR
jgi:predicted hydrocarbon binding protein